MSSLRIVLTLAAALGGPAAPTDRQADLMVREADALWRAHGVRVALRRGPAPPAAPGLGGDVVLTLRFAAPSALKRQRLGAIWLVDGVPQHAVEIVAADVTALVAAAPWGGRRLADWPRAAADQLHGRALGRVLAHELGHFLLASGTHSTTGLMRAVFLARDLTAADRRAFALDRDHLPRLRARVTRLAPPPANLAAEQP